MCKESGKERNNHDCVVRQCQELCKNVGGDEVIWYQSGGYMPNNYQCCLSKTPELAKQQTTPSCVTCKLVNEPASAPAEKSWYEILFG
jgi:hypothetical protein